MKYLDQATLKKMHESQQTEMGQVALKARTKYAEELKAKTGLSISTGEVEEMINIQTGEKKYYLK